jgi:hypothetical protein
MRQHARVCLDNQLSITFFLSGDDVIDDHRTTRGNCFLHGRAAGFTNEQVAGAKHAREIVGPADDIDLAIVRACFNCSSKFVVASDGYRQFDVEIEKFADQFRSVFCSGVDHVENLSRGFRRWWSILREIGEFRTDGETECLNQFGCDASIIYDCCALLVWDEKIIRGTSVPDRIDRDGIGDDDNAMARSIRSKNLRENVRIGREDRNNRVRLKPGEQIGESIFNGRKEAAQILVHRCLAIEPPIHTTPGPRPPVDQGQVSFAHEFVERAVGFGEEIVYFDFRIWRDPRETIPNSARRRIVTFAEARRENQNFFHESLRKISGENGRKFNGYFNAAK